MVWHHRRNSVRAYWRQQRGYGKAEAMLERKWPEKYNAIGHIPWAGRIYASYLTDFIGSRRGRIYHGTWGSALFQSVYQPALAGWRVLLMMPEWYLVILALTGLAAVGLLWPPLLVAVPLVALAAGGAVVHAARSAWSVRFPSMPQGPRPQLKRRLLTMALHLLQPAARLYGRLREGLTPWRRPESELALPRRRELVLWSEQWEAPEQRLRAVETALRAQRAVTLRGGDYDAWDIEVRGGVLGGVRVLSTVEEHGAGRQLMRLRVAPRVAPYAIGFVPLFSALALAASVDLALPTAHSSWAAAVVLGTIAAGFAVRILFECAIAMGAVVQAMKWLAEAQRAVMAHDAVGTADRAAPRWGLRLAQRLRPRRVGLKRPTRV
jgi:O-antigen biosynthesis protein